LYEKLSTLQLSTLEFPTLPFPILEFPTTASVMLEFMTIESPIFTYFNPSWSTLIFSLTDIQTLGYSLYLGYPLGIIILGIILWMVLIGILCISTR
jgi:NADH:ubiquinone oxidoreductase subunit 6 (subunit J)